MNQLELLALLNETIKDWRGNVKLTEMLLELMKLREGKGKFVILKGKVILVNKDKLGLFDRVSSDRDLERAFGAVREDNNYR